MEMNWRAFHNGSEISYLRDYTPKLYLILIEFCKAVLFIRVIDGLLLIQIQLQAFCTV